MHSSYALLAFELSDPKRKSAVAKLAPYTSQRKSNILFST